MISAEYYLNTVLEETGLKTTDDIDARLIKAMKMYANEKLQFAADNLEWDNCYDGGTHCAREKHEKSIESLKDEIYHYLSR